MTVINTPENSIKILASINYQPNQNLLITSRLKWRTSFTTLSEKVSLDLTQEFQVKNNSLKMTEKSWDSTALVNNNTFYIIILLMTLLISLKFTILMTELNIFSLCILREWNYQENLLWTNQVKLIKKILSKIQTFSQGESLKYMEETSISMDVMYSHLLISWRSITEISHLLVLKIQNQRNTKQDKSHHIMVSVLKKILFKTFIDLILKDQKQTFSNGWTISHF